MLRCCLAPSVRLAPRLARTATTYSTTHSNETTAQEAFSALGVSDEMGSKPISAEKDEQWKPYMYLPPLSSLGSGRHLEPLLNVPPPEDPLLNFLASLIMRHGERAKARRIVSKTLTYIFTLTRAPPLPILREAVLLASPAVKSKAQTHGAKVVHIPMALGEKHRTHYGLMWLLAASRARAGRRIEERLAREMVDIVQRVHNARDQPRDTRHSGALGLKYDMHRFATVNRGAVRLEPGAARAMAAAAEARITAPGAADEDQ
ncbi:ribosomal protein S7 domain-containing protein [Mycena polygramma]|nr:ribosomal protein S7 domain-containing protein [Mycena polygramma]